MPTNTCAIPSPQFLPTLFCHLIMFIFVSFCHPPLFSLVHAAPQTARSRFVPARSYTPVTSTARPSGKEYGVIFSPFLFDCTRLHDGCSRSKLAVRSLLIGGEGGGGVIVHYVVTNQRFPANCFTGIAAVVLVSYLYNSSMTLTRTTVTLFSHYRSSFVNVRLM